MKIISISDTHCRLRKVRVPEGELLLHAGDLTFSGDIPEMSQELRELGRVAKEFKHGCIVIPGNHDRLGEWNPTLLKQMCVDQGLTLLVHESIEIEGFKIFGSPYTPLFHNWAFNIFRGEGLAEKWAQIPDDTNILMTHGPAMGILDEVTTFNGKNCEWEVENVGCLDLYNRIQQLKNLKLHVFGHIHPAAGSKQINGVTYINASTCNEQYKPINPPIIFSL